MTVCQGLPRAMRQNANDVCSRDEVTRGDWLRLAGEMSQAAGNANTPLAESEFELMFTAEHRDAYDQLLKRLGRVHISHPKTYFCSQYVHNTYDYHNFVVEIL